MSSKLKSDLIKIEEKKKKIQLQEKILREKEKRKKVKRFQQLGTLLGVAEIDSLDDTILLGAFMEIAENKHNEESIKRWKEKGKNRTKEKHSSDSPIIIKFQNEPSKEEKDLVKKYGLKWNAFRKEFYGYGSKPEVEKLLNGSQCSIDIVS